jgi:hypothetical protein
MSKIADLRAAAVVCIGALTDGERKLFKSVDKHVGRYTEDDLRRLAGASPACAVGVVNVTRPVRRASGEIALDVTFAAVIVTRARERNAADDDALDLAVAVLASVNAWTPAQAVPKVAPAENLHAEGIGDEKLDDAGMVVWAVTWTHKVVLGTDEVAADIDATRRLAEPLDWSAAHPARGPAAIGGGL